MGKHGHPMTWTWVSDRDWAIEFEHWSGKRSKHNIRFVYDSLQALPRDLYLKFRLGKEDPLSMLRRKRQENFLILSISKTRMLGGDFVPQAWRIVPIWGLGDIEQWRTLEDKSNRNRIEPKIDPLKLTKMIPGKWEVQFVRDFLTTL